MHDTKSEMMVLDKCGGGATISGSEWGWEWGRFHCHYIRFFLDLNSLENFLSSSANCFYFVYYDFGLLLSFRQILRPQSICAVRRFSLFYLFIFGVCFCCASIAFSEYLSRPFTRRFHDFTVAICVSIYNLLVTSFPLL